MTFDKAYKTEKPNFQKWASLRFSNRSTSAESVEMQSEIIGGLFGPSLEMFTSLGFTSDDLEELFGDENPENFKDELVGSAIMLYHLQIDNYDGTHSEVSGSEPLAVSCFLEATGIAAGVALVGALTGQVGGKALRSAFKKAVKKIGSRFLGGVGLFLMAAEFTWCMTR